MNCPARLKRVVALFFLCGLAARVVAAPGEPSILIVDLYLNGQPKGESFVLQDANGEFLVSEDVLRDWQIVHPWPSAVMHRSTRYVPLAEFIGSSTEFRARTLELSVSMPAALMPIRTVDLERDRARPRIEDTGAYLDYDFNWVNHNGTGQETLYGLFRPVVFGAFGNVAANMTYRDYSSGNIYGDVENGSGLSVLELTYTRDDPERMRSLRIGDVVTSTSAHGRAVRMGGIQLATNFDTRPTFIRYPLPSFYGETAVPSALDVYINGQLRRSEQVQAGRYVLEDIPAINGAGQLQIVTRDALGRQQVFAQDFYLATDLLREGLSEYSLNIGALREDFALDNFRYGAFVMSGTWRHGVRNDLTIEGHGEYSDGTAMLGGGLQYGLESGGTLNAALAASTGDAGAGARWQLGYRQQSSVISYSFDVSGATRDFSLVGHYAPEPKIQVLASAGKNVYEYGSLGMSVIHQGFHESGSRTIVSATHSKTFANFLSLTSFVSVVDAESNDFTAGIRFSIPFGEHYSAGGGLSGSRGSARAEAEIRRSLPIGTGYGYHVGVSASDHSFIDAGAMLQSEVGRYTVDVRGGSNAGNIWEVGTSGSIAHLSGMTSFTRQIRDAFAVVNVGGLEGVRVYKENQEIGRTNANGQLLIPALRPYLGNQLRIELEDVPLNARIGNTATKTTPFYRSGVVVNFDVSVTTNVLLRAVWPDGRPVPEGAIARVTQSGELFPVGMDGKLYLQGIDRSSQIEIQWAGKACDIDVPYPASPDVISRVGDIVCEPRVTQ
jgi:outer membrane usher protein